MTAPNLFGPSNTTTLETLGLSPVNLAFSTTVDSVLPPIGANGAPNPADDPMGSYRYLCNQRELVKLAANQKPLIRLADENGNVLCAITNEESSTCEEMMADSGQAKVVIRYEHWLEDYLINGISIAQDLHLLIDPIPSYPVVGGIVQDWQIRWGGKVKEISLVNHEDGSSTIEIVAISNREHLKHLLIGSAPWLPPEIQLPQMWIIPGPMRSIAFITGFVNLARLFFPGLSLITNVFNPASWINPLNPDALLNLNPLSWPIQVAFVDPLLDTSMWSVLAASWTSWHETLSDLLSNAGCICRAYTWLTTDATSPHTDLTDILTGGGQVLDSIATSLGLAGAAELTALTDDAIDTLARPTRNCIVLSFEDKSGLNGPTGTALDGLLSAVGVTLDDLITTIIFDQDTGEVLDGEQVIDTTQDTLPLFQSALDVETAPPKVIWRDGQFTGLIRRSVNMHKGSPLTIMTGGRSPSLVNELQTFGIRYALSELSMVPTLAAGAGITYTPDNLSPQVPATPGLDNIYQGELDNVLLAWERYTDPLRALYTGELAFQEYIERGSSSAYTVAGWLALAEGHWKTRSFYGMEATYLNGKPWVYGIDYRLGDRVGFEMDAIVFVDQLTSVKFQYDRKTARYLQVSVGDDRDKHDPIARGMRMLQGVYSLLGAFVGEGTLFG